MKLPFGDWSGDGHCEYEELVIEAPNMESLKSAQDRIRKTYGQNFFKNFASYYQKPTITEEIWTALYDTGWYPGDINRYSTYYEYNTDIKTFRSEYEKNLPLEAIQSMFIFIMNYYGAEITVFFSDDIPQISNWTCPGFETVGYGCFDL